MKKRVLLMIMCVFAMTAASAQINSVAIVGAGVGGWPTDNTCGGPVDQNQMTKVDADNWILEGVVVTGGGIKFRANNCWNDATGSPAGLNLGSPVSGPAFPSGIGVNAGSSSDIKNITDVNNANYPTVVVPGTYTVKLNTTTLAYSFETNSPAPTVKLVGSSVNNVDVTLIPLGGNNYSITTTLLAGDAQFDVDGVLVSDNGFPTGLADVGLPAIPVTAGEWVIKLNIETGVYSFETPPFTIVGITGAAGPGWGNDYEFTTTDGINYTLLGGVFVEGGMLFRLDKDYAVKFGGLEEGANALNIFVTTSGTLVEGGKDIIIDAASAGTYDITFNRLTKEYTTAPSLSTKGFSTANFKVSPNPTNNNWNFTAANDSIDSIQILDVLGKKVMSISPRSNTANVDASSLTRGIYFAKVATAKATQTLKLMKN